MMNHIADKAEHIYIALGSTDFRKHQNGLASLISLKFQIDPYSGKCVFLFCNKKHNSLRALRWDGNGFILVTKFLSNEMKFQWPKTKGEVRAITKRQLEWLLDGLHIDQKKALKESVETTWQVNKEAGKLASSNSFIWVHRTGGCEEKSIILYQYTRSRAGEHAKNFLEDFKGFLVSDAYAGYEKVENITRCLCFSHLRRYYIEAIPLDSKKKEIPGSGGAIGRNFCDKLFKLKKQWKKLSPEERKKNRLIKSVPILDAFFAWVENTNTDNPDLKKAFKYTLNYKGYFTNFLFNGEIALSNNLSEQAVKPVAITRKNSLFSDSVDGAKASAIIFSIVNTATANNIDAYKYLEYIFKNLPNSKFPLEPSVLEEYLPWSDKIQAHCKVHIEEESYSESA